MLKETEEYYKKYRPLQLFQNINAIMKGFKKQVKFFKKNNEGTLITGQNDILEKWRDYFE